MTPEESRKYLQKSIFHLFSGASSLVSERDRGREKEEKKESRRNGSYCGCGNPGPLQPIPDNSLLCDLNSMSDTPIRRSLLTLKTSMYLDSRNSEGGEYVLLAAITAAIGRLYELRQKVHRCRCGNRAPIRESGEHWKSTGLGC